MTYGTGVQPGVAHIEKRQATQAAEGLPQALKGSFQRVLGQRKPLQFLVAHHNLHQRIQHGVRKPIAREIQPPQPRHVGALDECRHLRCPRAGCHRPSKIDHQTIAHRLCAWVGCWLFEAKARMGRRLDSYL